MQKFSQSEGPCADVVNIVNYGLCAVQGYRLLKAVYVPFRSLHDMGYNSSGVFAGTYCSRPLDPKP